MTEPDRTPDEHDETPATELEPPSDAAAPSAEPGESEAEALAEPEAEAPAEPAEPEPEAPLGPSGRPLQVVAYAGRTVNWGVLVGGGTLLGLVVGIVLVLAGGDANAAGWAVAYAVLIGAAAGGLLGLLLDLFARRSRRRR